MIIDCHDLAPNAAAVQPLADVTGSLDTMLVRVVEGAPVAGKQPTEVRVPAGRLIVSDADGNRIARPDTTLAHGSRYVVAVEPDVAEEVMDSIRG